jgi:hypothetical protein
MPRLELVRLLDRADNVLANQVRPRGLLRANALVAVELSLPVALRQIVGAARDLVGGKDGGSGCGGPSALTGWLLCGSAEGMSVGKEVLPRESG